jgi:hypothetical protein
MKIVNFGILHCICNCCILHLAMSRLLTIRMFQLKIEIEILFTKFEFSGYINLVFRSAPLRETMPTSDRNGYEFHVQIQMQILNSTKQIKLEIPTSKRQIIINRKRTFPQNVLIINLYKIWMRIRVPI